MFAVCSICRAQVTHIVWLMNEVKGGGCKKVH